jgi:hypothetical protein
LLNVKTVVRQHYYQLTTYQHIFTAAHCFFSTGVYDPAINNLGVRNKGSVSREKTTFCIKENVGACSQVNRRHISTVAHCFYSTAVYDPAINNLGVRNKRCAPREKTTFCTEENVGKCSQINSKLAAYSHRRSLLLLNRGV